MSPTEEMVLSHPRRGGVPKTRKGKGGKGGNRVRPYEDYTYDDLEIPLENDGPLYFEAPPASPATTSTVLTDGSHVLDGLQFDTQVPNGTSSFPVLIALHGLGDSTYLRDQRSTAYAMTSWFEDLKGTHIVVTPNAQDGDWDSREEHITILRISLLNYLATFSNVQPIFKFVGQSQGSMMINRILVDSDDPRIVAGVTTTSQLHEDLYHDNSFWSENYTVPKKSLTKRFVLQVTAGLDPTVPAEGGPLNVHGKKKKNFLPWQESAHRYAQGYGYSGAQASLDHDDATFSGVSYLGGQVQAYNVKSGKHDGCWLAHNVMVAYLLNLMPRPQLDAKTSDRSM